jgi:hypothetical protein
MVRVPTGLGAILAVLVFVLVVLLASGVIPFTPDRAVVLLVLLAAARLV